MLTTSHETILESDQKTHSARWFSVARKRSEVCDDSLQNNKS
uniref:Uncharacterized protein n=1 Tax=Moniliophthora roreri TaxID=221103 RepID=A0A0W0FIU3_MONRR